MDNLESHTLKDELAVIEMYLTETRINSLVVTKVIRGISNIVSGTGEGDVIVHVRGENMTIEARERDGVIKTKAVDTKV